MEMGGQGGEGVRVRTEHVPGEVLEQGGSREEAPSPFSSSPQICLCPPRPPNLVQSVASSQGPCEEGASGVAGSQIRQEAGKGKRRMSSMGDVALGTNFLEPTPLGRGKAWLATSLDPDFILEN